MALKTPVRVFRKTFTAGTSKSINFSEAGYSGALDSTHLILAFVFLSNTTVIATPSGWTSIFGGSTGSGPTQIRLVAIQGDSIVNGITFTTASASGSITLVAYKDFVSLTPITAAASTNVTTATTNYAIPDIGSGTANGIVFDMIGGPSTFVGATYNRGALLDATAAPLDASGQMILAQEYTDGTADQSVTVTMPTSRVGRYSAVVMPIGVGSGGGTSGTITGAADGAVADGGSASLLGSAGATMSVVAGVARGGVDDGFPETWPDEFGAVPAYLTGAGVMTGVASDSPAAGGSANMFGAALMSSTAGGAPADGGSALLSGAAVMTGFVGDAPADGGSATLAGAAGATMTGFVGDAPATGYDATIVGQIVGLIAGVSSDSPAAGGSATLVGGASSTISVIASDAPATGGDVTMIGTGAGAISALAGDGAADGGSATLTGAGVMTGVASDSPTGGGSALLVGGSVATMSVTAADALAYGGSATVIGIAPGSITALVGDAPAAGGTATFNGAEAEIAASHTFVIKPWNDGAGHDVDLHKRRAYAEIRQRPLARGRSAPMIGPDVVTHPDGSASVTYSLIAG